MHVHKSEDLPILSIDPEPYFLFLEQGSLTRYDLNSVGDHVTIGFPETFLAFDVVMASGDIIGVSHNSEVRLLFCIGFISIG
jgi:hypothetical protein